MCVRISLTHRSKYTREISQWSSKSTEFKPFMPLHREKRFIEWIYDVRENICATIYVTVWFLMWQFESLEATVFNCLSLAMYIVAINLLGHFSAAGLIAISWNDISSRSTSVLLFPLWNCLVSFSSSKEKSLFALQMVL